MTQKEQLLKNYLAKSIEALYILKNNQLIFLTESHIWQILAYELEYFDNPQLIIFDNLSSVDIVNYVYGYFSKNGRPIGEVILKNSILTDQFSDEIIKARLKRDGEIWTIHKSDKDTFPSQPHAHNYEKQLKLHLGNGKLYRKKNCVGKINYEELLYIREEINNRMDVSLPDLEKVTN